MAHSLRPPLDATSCVLDFSCTYSLEWLERTPGSQKRHSAMRSNADREMGQGKRSGEK